MGEERDADGVSGIDGVAGEGAGAGEGVTGMKLFEILMKIVRW
jgi:hypothetical protein